MLKPLGLVPRCGPCFMGWISTGSFTLKYLETHSYGKSQFFTGKSTISMAIFNIKLLVYQRVSIEVKGSFWHLWHLHTFFILYLLKKWHFFSEISSWSGTVSTASFADWNGSETRVSPCHLAVINLIFAIGKRYGIIPHYPTHFQTHLYIIWRWLVGCIVVKPDNAPSRVFHFQKGIVQYSGFTSKRFLGSPHMPWSCSLFTNPSIDAATKCKDPTMGWITPHVPSFEHGTSVTLW
jgi:hypothetical protein